MSIFKVGTCAIIVWGILIYAGAVEANRAYKARAYINVSSNMINAITWRSRAIVFHKGLMNFVKNKDELALIMGHELAHILNGDLGHMAATRYGNIPNANKDDELDADILGTILMHKAGYDCMRGAEVWKRFYKRMGGPKYKVGDSHPHPMKRYRKIKGVCAIQRMKR